MKTRTTLTVLLVAGFIANAAAAGVPTPAEQKIAAARTSIAKNPGRFQSHNDLAMALARRARETADPDYYTQAAAVLNESRRLAPDNLEADKIEAWLLLGTHEFARALEKALAINRRVPDDLMTYGMLVDAYMELGRYAEAEEAAQWMLDLRPGAVPGLTRAAYLREIFGDLDGALELMTAALDQTPARETEDRAWILTQMAHLQIGSGRVERAHALVEEALRLFPGYHYALGELARVFERRGDSVHEASILAERYRVAPHPENLFAWAEALARAGRTREARARFAEFERQARAEMDRGDNANRELALYYVDHARRPAEAVRVMAREIARRRDIHTLDTYAWALFAAGRRGEARRYAADALAFGTTDATIRRHAAVVLGRARLGVEAPDVRAPRGSEVRQGAGRPADRPR